MVVHVISWGTDGGATEADGGASAPVGPTVATPLDCSYATKQMIASTWLGVDNCVLDM